MVVGMHAFNRTSEAEKKVFISYNLFYYRLAVLLYPRTSRPVLSRYLFREESHLTEHPGCTIYPQPLPDSTGGSGYWLWHLHEPSATRNPETIPMVNTIRIKTTRYFPSSPFSSLGRRLRKGFFINNSFPLS